MLSTGGPGGLGIQGGPGPVWQVSFRTVTTLKSLSLFRVPTEPEEVAAEVFPSFAQSERAGPVELGEGGWKGQVSTRPPPQFHWPPLVLTKRNF